MQNLINTELVNYLVSDERRVARLFNMVTTIATEIPWNKLENITDNTYVEDNINLGNTEAEF